MRRALPYLATTLAFLLGLAAGHSFTKPRDVVLVAKDQEGLYEVTLFDSHGEVASAWRFAGDVTLANLGEVLP